MIYNKHTKQVYRVLPLLFVLVLSCGSGREDRFRLPDIPGTLLAPAERASYLVIHYWDYYDFTAASSRQETEQLFVDFVNILPYAPYPDACEGIRSMMVSSFISDSVSGMFYQLADKYLYSADSPMRNEDYFLPVLEKWQENPFLKESERLEPAHLYRVLSQNRPGMTAADFSFTLPEGNIRQLSQIKAPYTILFFNDPDCDACREASMQLKKQSLKQARVVSVYPSGDNLSYWLTYVSLYPEEWITGYEAIENLLPLYDLRTMPALLLLDHNKKVILKNTNPGEIEKWFARENPL